MSRAEPELPTPADVRAAQVRLTTSIRRTPVLELHGAELGVPAHVVLKLELHQHTGSFKARGALNALLTRTVPAEGVLAASGGNHGAAVAWAAQRLEVPATVFVPASSPPAKARRIGSYGADVRVVEGFYSDAAAAAAEWAAGHDVVSVHAYDEAAVVAGQGTVALEVREQVPDAAAVLVTTGGGGLWAGTSLACVGGGPLAVPVEPTACPSLAAAVRAGEPVDVEVGGLAADSTGARRAGSIATRLALANRTPVVGVSDAMITEARAWLWEECRVAAEPGGAVAFAGLLSGAWRPEPGSTVVVVVCGGNAVPA